MDTDDTFFFANNIVINGVVKILAAGLRHG